MSDEQWMDRAVKIARTGIAAGQSPFGAVIVRDGALLSEAHNEVRTQSDPSAHAEVMAIRKACKAIGDIDLSGCVIYSTCEPCPMCFAAIHWARLGELVFGARIADAAQAGFNEMDISNETMRDLGGSCITIRPGVMRDSCQELFTQWLAQENAQPY